MANAGLPLKIPQKPQKHATNAAQLQSNQRKHRLHGARRYARCKAGRGRTVAMMDFTTMAKGMAVRALALTMALMSTMQPALADTAQADTISLTAADGIVELANGASIDLDGDGTPETVTYELTGEDYDVGTLTVTAGDAELQVETYAGMDKLYAGRLKDDVDDVFLLVGEHGPSDDPYAYILRYSDGALTNIGGIPALPEDIAINGDVLTATVRANAIQTWFRESDFVIARLMRFDEDYNQLPDEYYVAESPRATYPMDTAVVLKRDVPLTLTPSGGAEFTLKAGERAILTATDDLTYVYVVPVDRAAHDWLPGGYLALSDYINVVIDGEAVMAGDVFDGLIFAD